MRATRGPASAGISGFRDMKLIITIDTEEDNWGSYSPTGATLGNTGRIPALQELFDAFHVRPTYLVTYPVATDMRSVTILKDILDSGRCEIGTHCHPWNTPPFEEAPGERNSMLCNLPADLQYRKLGALHNAIAGSFGITPVSFRAGRWGYGTDVARNLQKLGYRIDTSITPYINWSNHCGPDFTKVSPQPFRFSSSDIRRESADGAMIEIPATIGFLQQNFALCNSILETAKRFPIKYLRPAGILYRLRLVNKVWLSPEVTDGKTMAKLAQRMMKNNYPVINLVFHSPALKAGLTPFVKTEEDEGRFLRHIKEFLVFAKDAGIDSMTLSEILKTT